MTLHDDTVYLRHMLEHSREAISILANASSVDLANSRVQHLALLHLVEIVGEAASRVSAPTREKLSVVPWRGIIGMRNRIIHGYDTVSVEILWDTVVVDLPLLIDTLNAFLGPTTETR